MLHQLTLQRVRKSRPSLLFNTIKLEVKRLWKHGCLVELSGSIEFINRCVNSMLMVDVGIIKCGFIFIQRVRGIKEGVMFKGVINHHIMGVNMTC